MPDGSLMSSPFSSDVVERSPPRMSRSSGGGIGAWHFSAREIYDSYSPDDIGYPLPGSPTRTAQNNEYALHLIVNSHPFLPVFSVPVAIKELVEVASLFELAAKSFAGFVGGAYLNYRFGWKAFVRDVKTLSTITEDLESRIKDFNRLLEDGRSRKRMTLKDERSTSVTSNIFLQSSYGVTIKGDLRHTRSMKTWGTLTWGVNDDQLLPVDDLERFNLAWRTLFDLQEIDPETMWNLIPFSWLVDYFLNVGAVLQSQHMRYQIQPRDICIMRHFTHVATTAVTQKPASISIGNEGRYLREIKSRDVVNAPTMPTISFDLLRGDRWKVILALIAKFASK